MTRAGLPHSEIPGSKCVCHSPRLIAAYHVLHRLPVPRHPPYTLSNLTENPWVARSTLSAYKHRHEVHALSRISRHFQYEVVNERITSRPSSGQRILSYVRGPSWWRRPGSNRRPMACKAIALPAELRPQCCACRLSHFPLWLTISNGGPKWS